MTEIFHDLDHIWYTLGSMHPELEAEVEKKDAYLKKPERIAVMVEEVDEREMYKKNLPLSASWKEKNALQESYNDH